MPQALPFLSGFLSDLALGVFAGLSLFAGAAGVVYALWRAIRWGLRWHRRRAIRWDLIEEGEAAWDRMAGEVWIGCGCRGCREALARGPRVTASPCR